MAKSRSKKVIAPVIDKSQVEEVAAEYAQADAKIKKLNATIDLKLTKIREDHAVELALLAAKQEAAFEKLQKYVETNKEELFPGINEGKAKKKSFETSHGTIGIRTATPSIKNIKGFTWKAVTNLLKEFLPEYVRTKEEANKEKLLSDRDNVLVPVDEKDPLNEIPEEQRPKLSSLFKKCGVKVEQPDAFFIELKKEEVSA